MQTWHEETSWHRKECLYSCPALRPLDANENVGGLTGIRDVEVFPGDIDLTGGG